MTNDPIEGILRAWQNGRSALLYGPPATGKTRVLAELLRRLEEPVTGRERTGLNPHFSQKPFRQMPGGPNLAVRGLPRPVKTVWMTFHQSLSYEDFVIGLAPRTSAAAMELVPTAGVLVDAIAELQSPTGANSVVIFIDELNRGNAAKIFGEFLTFFDFDYRETNAAGAVNARRIRLPLRHLKIVGDRYESLIRVDGTSTQLAYPSYFPRHLYVVATMNSVDRTAIPIDSALARRFDRIDLRPDIRLLLTRWDLDADELAARAATPEQLTPADCATLILDRVNLAIAENFGTDFELGHGLVMQLDPAHADAWLQLARLWDTVIFPQIEERFSGRLEELASLLRIDELGGTDYAWRYRKSLSGRQSTTALEPVSIGELPGDLAKRSLQRLASRQPPS